MSKQGKPVDVMMALSGGVDSAVSLSLLKQAQSRGEIGRLEAAYIKIWLNEASPIGECPWESDIIDCQKICEKLGVNFRVVNLMEAYHEHVVKMLIDGYAHGITPNPDVACNRFIKFGALAKIAQTEGFSAVATGHYARRELRLDGRWGLYEGIDSNKDQSYFLAQISYDQLAHALFPIGGITKPQVRVLAHEFGLPVADKKDSQGICFLGKVKINDFLRHYLPDKPGPIVNHMGNEIGTHCGLHHYTLGQRHGMRIPSNADNEHYVVVGKDFKTNTLQVAFDHTSSEGLYQTKLGVHHLIWLHPLAKTLEELKAVSPPEGGWEISLLARPRYRDAKIPSRLTLSPTGEGILTFGTPQRAIASGQIVAFYSCNELIGSGVYL